MKPFLGLILAMAPLVAQETTALPRFEVASVKPVAPQAMPAGGGMVMRARGCGKPDPAMVRCNSATMKMLLMRAYNVKSYQIQGPSWIDSELFDLSAKIPDGTPQDQVPAMLQALIMERFGARIHKETKVLPAYELSIGKGGPKLKEIDESKLTPMPQPGDPLPAIGGGRGPGMTPVSSMPKGAIMMMVNSNGARTIRGNMGMDQLIAHLVNVTGRPVADLTGLKGTYEIELTYLGDEMDTFGRTMASLPPPPAGAGRAGDAPPGADANTPTATLTQALQQTLGLKLEAKKAPVEMIVLDSANKVPTEN